MSELEAWRRDARRIMRAERRAQRWDRLVCALRGHDPMRKWNGGYGLDLCRRCRKALG